MRRLLSFTAPVLVALALPALAQAKTGTVLSVAKSHHQVQIIGSNKRVSAYRYSGKLHGARRGSELHFAAKGSKITSARIVGTAKSFSFLATVVRSKNGALVLALGDSQTLHLSSSQVRPHASGSAPRLSARDTNITIQINGLQPGETVIVTESTDSSGNITITITLPANDGSGSGSGNGSGDGSGSGSGDGSGEQTAVGLVNTVTDNSFDIITPDGTDLTFRMNPDDLANVGMSPCDGVVVDYHTSGSVLLADDVTDNGAPDAGPCSSGGYAAGTWTGTITAVSATSITVDAGLGNGGPMTFTVDDPAITAGYLVGDSVNVTYEPWNGEVTADQVSYNDTQTSGAVTDLAAAGSGYETITMIDDWTDESETFYVPVDLLQGQDVQIGDDVSVSYYQSALGYTLDWLSDNGPTWGD